MAKKPKSRLDESLVRIGLADAIETAKALIMSGDVVVDDQRVDKPGTLVSEDAKIRLKDDGRFVSRGGDKLLAAVEDFGLLDRFKDAKVLDVGASTGGFTDCVLSLGAAHVTALDVGTAQLAWKLRQDPRVTSIEKTDIKKFVPNAGSSFDWVVADLSFTSLAKMIPDIVRAAPRAKMILLIKPQFELPRDLIPEGGVVTNDKHRQLAVSLVEEACKKEGCVVDGLKEARVTGRQGNREIFILLNQNATQKA